MGALGKPKTGGRKVGTPNKATQKSVDVLAACQARGLDVFGSMVEIALNEPDTALRLNALKDLATYLAPKKRSMDVTHLSEVDVANEEFEKMPLSKQAELLEQAAKRKRDEANRAAAVV